MRSCFMRSAVLAAAALTVTAAAATMAARPAPGVLWREDFRALKPTAGEAADNWSVAEAGRVRIGDEGGITTLAAGPGLTGEAALMRLVAYDLSDTGYPFLVLDLAGGSTAMWSGLSIALDLPSGTRRLLDFAGEPGTYLLDLRRLVPELRGRRGTVPLGLWLAGATTEQAGPAVRVRSLACVAAPSDRLEVSSSGTGQRPLRWSDTVTVVAVLSRRSQKVSATAVHTGPPSRPVSLDRRAQMDLSPVDDEGRCHQLTVALTAPAVGRGSQVLLRVAADGRGALFTPLGVDLEVAAAPGGAAPPGGGRPMTVRWVQPSYRGTLFADTPCDRLVAECRWEDDGGPETTVQARLLRGEEVVAAQETSSAGGVAQVMLTPGELPAGEYRLLVSAVRNGEPVATGDSRLRRLPPGNGSQVRLGNGGLLEVAGQVSLPFGWLRAGAEPPSPAWWSFQVGAEAAAPNGVAPVVNLSDVVGAGPDLRGAQLGEGAFTNLVARVEREVRHPRLLAWLLAERPEAQSVSPAYLAECYRTVAAIDPYHPVLVLVTSVDAAVRYSAACDGLILAAPAEVLPRLLAEVRARRPEQSLWALPLGNYTRYAALRQAYHLALMHGATGLLAEDAGAARSQPALRLGLRHLAGELGALRSWLLAPAVPAAANPELLVRAVETPSPLLVAVNRCGAATFGRLESPLLKGLTTLQVVGEGRQVNVLNGVLNDHFELQAVHVYTLPQPAFALAGPADIEEAVAAAR